MSHQPTTESHEAIARRLNLTTLDSLALVEAAIDAHECDEYPPHMDGDEDDQYAWRRGLFLDHVADNFTGINRADAEAIHAMIARAGFIV